MYLIVLLLICNFSFASRIEKPRKMPYLYNENASIPLDLDNKSRSNRHPLGKSLLQNTKKQANKKYRKHILSRKKSNGNLPVYVRQSNRQVEVAQNIIKLPSKGTFFNDTGIFSGDRINITITSDIIGHRMEELPVSLNIASGRFSESVLNGYSFIDPQTKRLRIKLTELIRSTGAKYKISAEVTDNNGLLGLEGKIDSKFWPYFGAYLLANAVGDYTTSRIQTSNSFNGPVPKVSTDNALKQATGKSIKKSSDMLVERLKNYPEIVKVIGPLRARVLIIQEPNKI